MMERRRMDKHGWLKVLEAVIAITLLIGFLLYLMSTSAPKKDISRAVNEKELYILDLISQNDSFRDDIVMFKDNTYINATIVRMIPASWDFETRICNLSDICEGRRRPLDRDVYANEVVISSTDTVYEPKKLRLFVWAYEGSKNPTSFPPMTLTTTAWVDGDPLPTDFKCGNKNPSFTISDISSNARSLILTLTNSNTNELYWMVWDIPVTGSSFNIPELWSPAAPIVVGHSENNPFLAKYNGPCSVDTYIFKVYSLRTNSIGLTTDNGHGVDAINLRQELINHQSDILQTATYRNFGVRP